MRMFDISDEDTEIDFFKNEMTVLTDRYLNVKNNLKENKNSLNPTHCSVIDNSATNFFLKTMNPSQISSIANSQFYNSTIKNLLKDKHIPIYFKPDVKTFGRNKKGSASLFHKCIRVFSENHRNNPDSFYNSLKCVVIIAQYFAVLPVTGVRGSNYTSIKFRWFHYKILYWVLSLLGTVFHFICFLKYSLLTGIYTKAASRVIFFGSAIVSSILSLNLGYNWRTLNEEFVYMENSFKKYGYPQKIGFKFRILTAVFLFWSASEHLLAKFIFVNETNCEMGKGDFMNHLNSFFNCAFKEVFYFHDYNLIFGLLMFMSNFLTSAIWTFHDLILAFISYSLAERFKQINNTLQKFQSQDLPIHFWKEIREDYNDLTKLTKTVDSYIQKIMFISMGHDLFFLCIKLFNSLQQTISLLKILYFFMSFGFQLSRTIFMTFLAAGINDKSKEPKTILYSVPHNSYSAEVRRFLTQVTTNEVALTGCGFFSITRSLILTILGTVITYEIVLVQFTDSSGGINLQMKNN